MTDERRYDEVETAQILERATQAEQARAERGASVAPLQRSRGHAGMTLQQLEDIATEVGLRPDDVRAAAKAVERGDMVPTQRLTVAGVPIGVSRTITLDRAMSDMEWERLVVVLRETFQARGKIRREGSLREWSNGNLHALLEPTATGHQLRLSTRKGGAPINITMGALFTVMGSSILSAGVGPNIRAIMGALLALGGIGTIVYSVLALPRWAKTRATQMESLAEAVTRILDESNGVAQLPERTD